MSDSAKASISVAYDVDSEGRQPLSWNDNWGALTLPLTKLNVGLPSETPEQAGVRAAAEVLGVPTRVVLGKAAKVAHGLEKSPRDGDSKGCQYKVVPVEVHPEFASHLVRQPLVWAAIGKCPIGECQAVSNFVEALLQECVEWGWVS